MGEEFKKDNLKYTFIFPCENCIKNINLNICEKYEGKPIGIINGNYICKFMIKKSDTF